MCSFAPPPRGTGPRGGAGDEPPCARGGGGGGRARGGGGGGRARAGRDPSGEKAELVAFGAGPKCGAWADPLRIGSGDEPRGVITGILSVAAQSAAPRESFGRKSLSAVFSDEPGAPRRPGARSSSASA